MTTRYTRIPITIDGRAFIRERYVPRSKPEPDRNRSREEDRRRRQAQSRGAT